MDKLLAPKNGLLLVVLAAVFIYNFAPTQTKESANAAIRTFNGAEVHFTHPVAVSLADKLGQVLVDAGVFSGDAKKLLITRKDHVYQVYLAVQDQHANHPDWVDVFSSFLFILQDDVFGSDNVELFLSDNKFEPIRQVEGWGHYLKRHDSYLFYQKDVMRIKAEALVNFFQKTEFFNEQHPVFIKLSYHNGWELKMHADPETAQEESVISALQAFTRLVSTEVFNLEPVRLFYTDESFNVYRAL